MSYRRPGRDIGVGGREIGYMFGQYKRITNRYEAASTGKGLTGAVPRASRSNRLRCHLFHQRSLKVRKESFDGKVCLFPVPATWRSTPREDPSARRPVRCLLRLQRRHLPQKGLDVELIKQLKEVERRRIQDYATYHKDAKYIANGNIWEIPAGGDAVGNPNEIMARKPSPGQERLLAVAKVPTMPTTPEGSRSSSMPNPMVRKAANAGGVATSPGDAAERQPRLRSFEFTEKKLENSWWHQQACYDTAKSTVHLAITCWAPNISVSSRWLTLVAHGMIDRNLLLVKRCGVYDCTRTFFMCAWHDTLAQLSFCLKQPGHEVYKLTVLAQIRSTDSAPLFGRQGGFCVSNNQVRRCS